MRNQKHDIIVVGASAGGVEALQQLTASLPPNLPAAVFVVMHMPPYHHSQLASILGRHSLPAVQPHSGERIEPGRIYVARPDYHLLIEDEGRIGLWRGPKENNFRPSINVLFRSAAVVYRNRVIGVVLSGSLDDGATGLWWIKRFGGQAIVQDPQEARFPQMPQSALWHVAVDHVARLADMGPLLTSVAGGQGSDATMQRTEGLPKWKPEEA